MTVEAVNIERKIRDNLMGIRHMSLSTNESGSAPWPAILDFAHSEDLTTVCFRSLLRRRHSQNIDADPRVTGTISRQYEVGRKPIECVTFAGMAALVGAGAEQQALAELLAAKSRGNAADIVARAADPDDMQIFRVDVANWYLYAALESSKPETYVLPMGASE